jgi:mitochondrial import receptor subunit TOM40
MPFEGAKLVINKSLNNGFQVSHSVTMSSLTPSGYRFGATYIGCNMVSYKEGIYIVWMEYWDFEMVWFG